MGRVPGVGVEAVAVGVGKGRNGTHAGVVGLVDELDAATLELLARLGDVCDAQRDRRAVRVPELPAERLRVDQIQEGIVPELELGEAALAGLRQTERVAIPRGRALEVRDRHRDEVDVLDVHAYGAKRLWSTSGLP